MFLCADSSVQGMVTALNISQDGLSYCGNSNIISQCLKTITFVSLSHHILTAHGLEALLCVSLTQAGKEVSSSYFPGKWTTVLLSKLQRAPSFVEPSLKLSVFHSGSCDQPGLAGFPEFESATMWVPVVGNAYLEIF